MKTLEQFFDLIKTIHTDFRAEVILAELQKMGLDAHDYIISLDSLFERRFGKDLKAVSIDENKSGVRYLNVKLNREGIYDGLPQALIHSSLVKKSKPKRNAKEMVDEIKIRRAEEAAARKFFSPFENEIFNYRINLEREERRILHAYQNNVSYTEKVDYFWNLPKIMNPKEKSTLLFLLPILHRITGDFKKTEACYSAVLNVPVAVKIIKSMAVKVPNQTGTEIRLGANFICGTQVHDSNPYVEVSLGPMNNDKIKDFLPGSRGRKVIDALNNYFMPIEAEVCIKTVAENSLEKFVINKTNAQGRIGITTRL
ncbi:MAG: type VI secretion system baseplate subunit TssG [Bacteroidota bacterium]|jgi:hypothetical protein